MQLILFLILFHALHWVWSSTFEPRESTYIFEATFLVDHPVWSTIIMHRLVQCQTVEFGSVPYGSWSIAMVV